MLECPRCGCEFEVNARTHPRVRRRYRHHSWLANYRPGPRLAYFFPGDGQGYTAEGVGS
jgi:hypothetical protein